MARGHSLLRWLCLLLIAAGCPPAAVAAVAEPITVKDPHYGEVLFYFYQQDYFPAIVRLTAAQQRQQFDHHADEAELLLGGMYYWFNGRQPKLQEVRVPAPDESEGES